MGGGVRQALEPRVGAPELSIVSRKVIERKKDGNKKMYLNSQHLLIIFNYF